MITTIAINKVKRIIKYMSPPDRLTYLSDCLNSVEYSNPTDKFVSFIHSEMARLRQEIETLENNKKEQLRQEEMQKFQKCYQSIQNLSDNLPKDKYGDNMLWCKMLLNKLRLMVQYVEEKKETYKYTTKIFDIYIPEIINICANIPNKKANNYVDYMKNLNKVLCQLNSLTDVTIEKILNSTNQTVEASFNVLIREMENDKKIL